MADISITDINGRIVMRQRTADNNTEMNISQLSPGVYMVKVMENGKLNNWKFVKE
ncbi:MAG: T9SS type A sorting domain-containing protein, partial [Dinghuibacter sp.]|nr:T9SS type A sorting domain-containing protein [Dinghuibacter sp.]